MRQYRYLAFLCFTLSVLVFGLMMGSLCAWRPSALRAAIAEPQYYTQQPSGKKKSAPSAKASKSKRE